MLNDGPDPNPQELKKLLESLCQNLRAIKNDVPADMRNELQSYLTTLEQSSQGVVDEFEQAKESHEEALRKTRAQAAARPPAPPVKPEEDVLALGATLRAQLLERYRLPPVGAAPVVHDDVSEMSTNEFRTLQHEMPATKEKTPPSPPASKNRPVSGGDDAQDITSSEWDQN